MVLHGFSSFSLCTFQIETMTEVLNNEKEPLPGSKPATPAMENNNLGTKETEYVNAKAYMLTASTKSGLNL